MCVFNDKIIAARDLNAFNLERYLCRAKFECFQPCFRAKNAEISEKKKPAWLVSPLLSRQM